MRELEYEYKVWWCPWRRRTTARVPSQWYEIDRERLLAVSRAAMGAIGSEEYFARMLGMPQSLYSRLDSWSIYQLQQQLRWIDEGRAETTRMIIDKVETLRAPGDALDGVSLQQFMTVDTFFDQYTKSITDEKKEGDIRLLCRFVAALYLRPRERYALEPVRKTLFDLPGQNLRLVDIDANARMLEQRADRDILHAIHLNWILIRSWLSRAYPYMFPESDGEGNGPAVRNVWLTFFDSFVGDDVAHMDEYRQMACTDAFRVINKRIKDSLKKK